MLNEKELETIESIIGKSRASLSLSDFDKPKYESEYTHTNPKVEATKEVISNKFKYICEELGIEEDGINAGCSIISQLLDYAPINTITTEDTIESAMTKMAINEALKESAASKKKKDKFGISDIDEFKNNEISNVNKAADKMSSETLDNNIIKNVQNATTEFIEKRNERMEKIKAAYQNIIDEKNKNTETLGGNEDKVAAAEEAYKLIIHKDKQRVFSLYEAIVDSIANQFFNEETKQFVTDKSGKLNMDNVIDISSGIYAALETLNQYNTIDFDSEIIETTIDNLYL